ncbi:TPA: hypothetical protein OCD45_000752 [Escherichia coli]|nr:hypothetical protein [Escherichia coli]
MITITKEFTKEQLQQIEAAAKEVLWPVVWSEKKAREHFSEKITPKVVLKLARIALASLEAEPAIHRWRRVTVEPYGPYPWHYGNFIGFSKPVEGIEDEYFYSAPPAQLSVPDERYQQLSELYHAQEKRLFKLAQRIKGQSFDKYAHSPSQAIDVLESAIFGEREDDCRTAMLHGADGNSPVIPDWQAEAEKMAEIHGSSFVVFRNGESPKCANPTKVIISFTDESLGHGSAAPQQEVKS